MADCTTYSLAESKLTGHTFSADVSSNCYNYRILKMNNSVFIYIGERDNELFDELVMAVPSDSALGTTILGSDTGFDSKEIAIQMARRLKKQVFISCNVHLDNLLKPLIIKRLAKEISEHPEAF